MAELRILANARTRVIVQKHAHDRKHDRTKEKFGMKNYLKKIKLHTKSSREPCLTGHNPRARADRRDTHINAQTTDVITFNPVCFFDERRRDIGHNNSNPEEEPTAAPTGRFLLQLDLGLRSIGLASADVRAWQCVF